jgi:hypothetical protein
MSTLPSISYLALDANYDPIFADGTSLTGVDAIAQAIGTRLRLFLGEWWAALNVGLPVFQSMLGQLGSAKGLAAMRLSIQQNVEGAPYVTGAVNVEASFVDGVFQYTVTALTIYGPVTVSNAPAQSAALNA